MAWCELDLHEQPVYAFADGRVLHTDEQSDFSGLHYHDRGTVRSGAWRVSRERNGVRSCDLSCQHPHGRVLHSGRGGNRVPGDDSGQLHSPQRRVAWPGDHVHCDNLHGDQSERGVLLERRQLRDFYGRGVRGAGWPVPRAGLGVREHDLPTGDGGVLPAGQPDDTGGVHPDNGAAMRQRGWYVSRKWFELCDGELPGSDWGVLPAERELHCDDGHGLRQREWRLAWAWDVLSGGDLHGSDRGVLPAGRDLPDKDGQ